MNITKTTRRMVLVLCVALTMGILSTTALAVDGIWNTTVGGSWTNTSNWSAGVVPGGIGSAIIFSNSTVDSTVTLDGNRTIGSLQVGLGNKKWYFQPGTGGTLTLDTGTVQQPTIITTNGGNRTIIYAPVAGTNGFILSGTDKSRLELIATNTYSGVTRLTSAYLHVRTGAALGNSPRVALEPSGSYATILFPADGATLTNTIFFRAGMGTPSSGRAQIQTESVAGSADPTIHLNGDIIASGNSASINQIINDQYADLIVNGAVTNDGSAGVSLTFTGDKGRIIVNGQVNLTGALVKNGLCTNILNASGNAYGADLNFYSGSLIMGATNALCPSYAFSLNQFGSSATLDLNGYDQTVMGLMNGLPSHRITSATPAKLTLDSSANYNLTLGGTIDGALSLVKRGAGTQQFGALNTNLMTGGTFVYGGTNLMNGYSRANVTVDGGTFNGSGRLEYRMGATPDKMTLLSGTLDVSHLNMLFTGTPTLKTYTVVDYAAGGTFTTSGTTNIFASAAGVPSGYKLVQDAGAKMVYLRMPQAGTTVLVR